MRLSTCVAAVLIMAGSALVTAQPSQAHDPNTPLGQEAHRGFVADREPASLLPSIQGTAVPCKNGMASSYPCSNVDLLSHLSMTDLGGGQGNDIWGWTDPSNNREYAIFGRSNGTSFVDVTDPVNPVYLGNLASHTGSAIWRDMKVFKNHAFIVSEASGHGMQVFDLTRLRGKTGPSTWSEDAFYGGVGNTHNIGINEDTGFAYLIGTQKCGRGGAHMLDINSPKSPKFVGCIEDDGYTHDIQCVVYNGPDADYKGREVCASSNEDTLNFYDVTDKAKPKRISRMPYTGSSYTHQGWFTEDQRYFLLDDELDEQNSRHGTRTYMWDVTNLDKPVNYANYTSKSNAIDHNLYVKGNYAYEANYQSGLRIINLADVGSGKLTEAGFFDVYPNGDSANFNGAWSNYPYFKSGIVVVSAIEGGLFVVRPTIGGGTPDPDPENEFSLSLSPTSGSAVQGTSATATVGTKITSGKAQDVKLTASGAPAGVQVSFAPATVTSGANSTMTVAVGASVAPGTYPLEISGAGAKATQKATYTLTVTGTGGGDGPCSGLKNTFTGKLVSGEDAIQPNGSYFYVNAGQHKACLDGPDGADFDLYLQRWSGSRWTTVARGATASADETLSYSGTAAYYRYQVSDFSGAGDYTLGYDAP